MKTDETNPSHWFLLARERLEAADAVFAARGACYSAVELLQEAVERYLKGFLVGRGWELQRIHNLAALLDEAIEFDSRFEQFLGLCEELTAQFWEQHYPGGDLTDVGGGYAELRAQAGRLAALITEIDVKRE